MNNIFIKYIEEGRITSFDDLKRYYRKIVMKTHPDAVGSDRLVDKYIEYRNYYEEAKAIIKKEGNHQHSIEDKDNKNYRLLFYREFYKLERIDEPYAFNKYYHTKSEIELTKERVYEYFCKWKKEHIQLYKQANLIYDQIKREKPRGPYRKYALLFNLSPIFHNILSYQLTGLQFYKKQLRQNFAGIMHQLEERKFDRLIEYIQFLIKDMECGPVIQESD